MKRDVKKVEKLLGLNMITWEKYPRRMYYGHFEDRVYITLGNYLRSDEDAGKSWRWSITYNWDGDRGVYQDDSPKKYPTLRKARAAVTEYVYKKFRS